MTPQPEREQFLDFLRRRGRRVTRERLALFDEIFSQHTHIDADSILSSMRRRGMKISRATVYRNLELLVEAGLVRRHRLGQRRLLFEHIHPGQEHDHLLCTDCGRVVEFVSPGIGELRSEICLAHGFESSHHHLKIFGRCPACTADGREALRAAHDGRAPEAEPQAEGSDRASQEF